MRIESSQLQLHSSHQAFSRYTREEQLDVVLPNQQGQLKELHFRHQQVSESSTLMTYENLRKQTANHSLQHQVDRYSGKVEATQRMLENTAVLSSSVEPSGIVDESDEELLNLSPDDKMRIAIIQSLFFSLTGREIEFSINDLRAPKAQPVTSDIPALSSEVLTPAQGASLEYQVFESFYQQESSQFNARGVIKTADGNEIQIDFSLNMSRELFQQRDFSLRLGAALQDPLVISFDGKAAELTQQRFEFDLTLDGKKDWIPGLGQQSAFLALDRNGDGIINDGSELFGAKTGDGFAELAQYDHDKNGWIDENDDIFQHLKLWLKPGEGDSQQLVRLSDAGIGAIYLGNASTPFTLNNSNGSERLGVIRSSGIYVSDQGKAGLIQHVDLSV